MIRVIELFGGIGACTKALERLNIPHEVVDYVEIDKYAVKSFNAIHGTNFEPQDITKWDKYLECDLIMHGSPCQDFSAAGKGAGGDEGSGTRSSLMYETLRIVEKLKPKYVIWENVKNLLSKKHRHNFDAYQQAMLNLGYNSYYKVLNAKDYGIPQNRERVFTVSIRNDGEFDSYYIFPEPIPLERKLKDMLDSKVDERYYISSAMMDYFMGVNQKPSKFPRKERFLANINRKDQTIANTVTTNAGQRPTDNFVRSAYVRNFGSKGKLEDKEGEISTLQAAMGCGGGNIPIVVASRGRGPENKQQLEPRKDGLTNTLTSVQKDNYIATQSRLRKLTPKECWRLMGFDDSDFEKAEKVNSNTQLYKQAGNSIVVNVLEAILSNLVGEEYGRQ